MNKKRIFLIDGTHLAYRSYFAFIRAPLTNARGENTSAVFGFANTLRSLIRSESPEYIVAAFDISDKTFRHEQYSEYKATREKMPDDMRASLPRINELLDTMNITRIGIEGYEADDIIGTLAKQFSRQGFEVLIVTADKDFMQLVDDSIRLYDVKSIAGETSLIGREEVKKKFGVMPEHVTDVLALMGDSSDNIPGVPQIGPKTAQSLLEKFECIETLYEHIDEVKPERIKATLIEHKDNAFLSKQLATIDINVPIPYSQDEMRFNGPDVQKLVALYKDLEFTSLLKDYEQQQPEQPVDYHCVQTWNDFESFIKLLKRQKGFAFDTETDNISPIGANLVGLSFAFSEQEAFYIPAIISKTSQAQESADQGELFAYSNESALPEVLQTLKPMLEDATIEKYGHNIKYDALVLANYGINLNGITFDTMIASYLLRPTAHQHNLDAVSLFYLNYKKIPTSDLLGSGKNQITMDQVPIEKITRYACEDADITLRLKNMLQGLLDNAGLTDLFNDLEVPLISVLQAMEQAGICINPEFFENMSKELADEISILEQNIYSAAGEEFNINSPQQLGSIMFDKLELHKESGYRPKKTKIGYGTNIEVLETLSDQKLPCLVLEYRQLAKLKSTYVDSLPQLINPKTGRIHTSFNQTVAATGRLSSSDPNLQNIPIRTELGKKIRKGFIASDNDNCLISADYSQIELRILAHLSQDKTLIEAFESGKDIHAQTASLVFGIPLSEVTSELRSRAKAINFGIVYGMGQQKLAKDTGITAQEAKQFIESYFEKYPGIKHFIDKTLDTARRQGYVTTLINRRREIPEIHSENNRIRVNAEHIAINTPIQGTCADMIKLAMLDIHRKLHQNKLKTKMLLQIHDELVFEAPCDELDDVQNLIKSAMENALPLLVPVLVEMNAGCNWMEI